MGAALNPDLTVGVLALQGAFLEHLTLLRKAATHVNYDQSDAKPSYQFLEVRTEGQLLKCDALIIPGGESTAISLVAARDGLLEPLRHFVKVDRKPTWGTCAGLILLAEAANATKKGGQDLVGGLDVRVNRNHFGRQIESFITDLNLPFLKDIDDSSTTSAPFPGVFIRAPIVEKILPNTEGVQLQEQQKSDTVVAPSRQAKDEQAKSAMSSAVEIMAILPGRVEKAAKIGVSVSTDQDAGDIVAVRQGNCFGTSFHPELTEDVRIHVWWLREVWYATKRRCNPASE